VSGLSALHHMTIAANALCHDRTPSSTRHLSLEVLSDAMSTSYSVCLCGVKGDGRSESNEWAAQVSTSDPTADCQENVKTRRSTYGIMLSDLLALYNIERRNMNVRVLSTNEARNKWRDVVDAVSGEQTCIVVERYGKPMVAVIAYADYVALQDELDDLQAARRAAPAYEAWRQNPSLGRPYSEIRKELVAEGLLDERA